ncbi:MAG: histidine phosphatase family protein [Clostridiales bacterium]|nr:histidine phosphatase family protein [Clostridiales bacterium]
METNIFMVRHAESLYVNGKEKQRGLSSFGLQEANKVSLILKDIEIDAIYSSDYNRSLETVKPLSDLKKTKIIELTDLRERRMKPEHIELTYNDFIEAVKKSYENFDFSISGGESIRDVHERAIPVIEMIIKNHKGKNIVIGTHGNLMTMIMKYYDDSYGYSFWEKTSMPDIYVLTFNENKLIRINRKWNESAQNT